MASWGLSSSSFCFCCNRHLCYWRSLKLPKNGVLWSSSNFWIFFGWWLWLVCFIGRIPSWASAIRGGGGAIIMCIISTVIYNMYISNLFFFLFKFLFGEGKRRRNHEEKEDWTFRKGRRRWLTFFLGFMFFCSIFILFVLFLFLFMFFIWFIFLLFL